MAKRKANLDPDPSLDISLEAAMAELSQIVTLLESGQESLEGSLAGFERGMQLLRICHRKLDSAAQRVEILTRVSGDDVITAEFDSTSSLSKSAQSMKSSGPSGDADPDEAGRLF